MTDKVQANVYLVLVPEITTWGGTKGVRSIRVDRMRATAPKLDRGEIVVHVKMNFNKQDLIDSIPVVEIDVSSFKASDIPTIEIT